MLVEEELARFSPKKDMVLTIGVFDGVHLGHKYLLSRLKEQAAEQDSLSGVVTFYQHPLEVISPQTRLPYLTTHADKVSLLKNEGVDAVISLSFTAELARLSAYQFASLLKKYLRMRGLVIGPDFVFGRNREGDVGTLRTLGKGAGFSVMVVSPAKVNGEVVSSTAVRGALAQGDMKKVARLIGRLFCLRGKVVSGDGRGSELGFPTANLAVDAGQALPQDGVYATLADFDGQSRPSVTNIGWRPTFGAKERSIETYIIDYQGDLYGRELKIDIVERLRGEKQFPNLEELKKQIARDVEQRKAVLNSAG